MSEAGLGQQKGLPGQLPKVMQYLFLLLTGSQYPELSIPAAAELAGAAHNIEAGLREIADRVRRHGAGVAAAAGHSAAGAAMAAVAAGDAAAIDGLADSVGQLGGWLDDLADEAAALRVQAITYLAGLAATPLTDMALAAAGPAAWLEFLITEMSIIRVVLESSYGKVLAVVARGTAAQVISQGLLGIEAQGADLALHISRTWSWASVLTDLDVALWGEALTPISAAAERFSHLIKDTTAGHLLGTLLVSPAGAGGHTFVHEYTFWPLQGGSISNNPSDFSYGAAGHVMGRASHATTEAAGITPVLPPPPRIAIPAALPLPAPGPLPLATPASQPAAVSPPATIPATIPAPAPAPVSGAAVNPITGAPLRARPITTSARGPRPATGTIPASSLQTTPASTPGTSPLTSPEPTPPGSPALTPVRLPPDGPPADAPLTARPAPDHQFVQGGNVSNTPGTPSFGATQHGTNHASHAASKAAGVTSLISPPQRVALPSPQPLPAPKSLTTPSPQPLTTPPGQPAATRTAVNPITGVPIPARPITAPRPGPGPATPRPRQAPPPVLTPQSLTITPPAPERRTPPPPGAGHIPGPRPPAATQSPPTTVPTPPQSPDPTPTPAPARPLTPHTATTPPTTTPPTSRQPTPVPQAGHLAQPPARSRILAGAPADGRTPAGPLHLGAAPLAARQSEPGGISPGWPGDAVPSDSQASGQALITWAQDQAKAGGEARLVLARLGLYNLPPLPAAARAIQLDLSLIPPALPVQPPTPTPATTPLPPPLSDQAGMYRAMLLHHTRPAARPSGDQPRTRMVLLPGISGVTVPGWASRNSAGISTRLSPAPARRMGGMRPAGAAPLRPVRYRGHASGDQRHAGLGRLHRAAVPPRLRNKRQQHGLTGPAPGLEHPGALMRGATGWPVRRPGAVPTWTELQALAAQTVVRTAADGPGGRLGAAPGREVGRCVALALAWRGTLFPGGIAATAAADDLVAGRRGLLAGLVAAGGWVRVGSAGQVEAMLASTPGGLYAMVVWEPAGQVAGHATVWHAHRAGPAVRWMDLEAGQGQWMGPGGPPGFAAGHARAVFVSAQARVLDPPAATPADSADPWALLEFAPARPVTGNGKNKDKKKKKKDKEKGEGEGEANSSSTPKTPKDIAKDYRNKTGPGAVLGRRNVAAALYDIDGYSGQLIGVSGTTDRPGSVGMPTSEMFDKNKPADAEWKIFENLATWVRAESSGTVGLYSEFPVCSSCQSVIQQFQDMFPGVGVDVTSE